MPLNTERILSRLGGPARVRNLAWAIAAGAAVLAVYHALVGPLRTEWFGVTLASDEPLRAGLIATLATGVALWIEENHLSHEHIWWRRLPARTGAIVLASATLVMAVWHMTGVASASDPYGYVSQALLWAHGQVRQLEPLTTHAVLGRGGAPLGYIVDTPGTIVPIYPPGLPLFMAAAARIAGERAVFLVVPLLGALTVWLTFVLGRQLASASVGLASAALVAAGPMFVFQLFVPMSDVPATCWWLAALVAALSTSRWAGFLAGLAVSAAVLTRPNLLPLAAPIIFLLAQQRSTARALAAFVVGIAPGLAALAAINTYFYGAPLRSGYGRFDELFRLSFLSTNLRDYPAWLLHVYGPLIFVGLAAPLFNTLRKPGGGYFRPRVTPSPMHRIPPQGEARESARWRVEPSTIPSQMAALLVFVLAVFGCYVFYLPMDGWPSVRFLLPAIPPATVLGCLVARAAIVRLPPRARPAASTVGIALTMLWSLSHTQRLGAFAMAAAEQRYIVVADYINRSLPANAVVLSNLHSGTTRFYGHRTSVRWTEIAPGDLHRAIALLRSLGLEPFVALDSNEEPLFRERFSGDGPLGQLTHGLVYEYRGEPGVRVYSLGSDNDTPR